MNRGKMLLYFDTNVYRFVRAIRETRRMRELFASYGCSLVASSTNLYETFAISSWKEQLAEVQALAQLADQYERYPVSWHHASELRTELKRKRPTWLRSVSFTGNIKRNLRGHAQRWKEALAADLPSPAAYAAYSRDAEQGVAVQREAQKQHRADAADRSNYKLMSPDGQMTTVNLCDPEVSWRVEALTAWYAAVEGRAPASRDYADWIAPYLRPRAFTDGDYTSFWLGDASADTVVLNRLTGLISFYQLEEKITHGNAADQFHGNHWLLSDLFFTADKAFHAVLAKVADKHFPALHKPILIDRSSSSCVDQVERALLAYNQPS